MPDSIIQHGSGDPPDPSDLELEQLLSIGTACDLARSLIGADPTHLTPNERAALRGHINGCQTCRDKLET